MFIIAVAYTLLSENLLSFIGEQVKIVIAMQGKPFLTHNIRKLIIKSNVRAFCYCFCECFKTILLNGNDVAFCVF